MKKLLYLLGVSFLAVLVLAGCGPTAHIDKKQNVNFNKYRSYAWAHRQDNKRTSFMEQSIKDAVAAQLLKKSGWKENKRNPDVIISYDVLVERGSRVQSDPMYSGGFFRSFYNPYRGRMYNVYYPSMFMGYDSYSVPTREGTLTITMVDADTDVPIFQGWSNDEVDTRKLSVKEVNRLVNAIFKKW